MAQNPIINKDFELWQKLRTNKKEKKEKKEKS